MEHHILSLFGIVSFLSYSSKNWPRF